MSSLETHLAGSEDRLIDGLHFGGRNTASYVVERRDAQFHPSSASAFKVTGVRLIRFNLADVSGWLDGASLRFAFTVTETGGAAGLNPVTTTPLSIFRRMRIIANGSCVVEDIEDMGRVAQLFSMLQSSQQVYNLMSETWGTTETASTLTNPGFSQLIPANGSKQLLVRLPSSFLQNGKWIPLHMVPLTIEMELGEVLLGQLRGAHGPSRDPI